MTEAGRTLWRHPDFLKLWTAQAISAFGARITREGLPTAAVLALAPVATPMQLGILAALTRGPALVVGLFGGGFVDRARKRRVMIAADLIRAAVLTTVPLAAAFGALSIWHFYAVAVLVGGASVLFDIADNAYLPSILEREELVEGNAKLASTESVAEIGGPQLAGILFQALTAPFAIAVNAGSYLASGVILMTIGRAEPRPQAPETLPKWWEDVAAGLRVVMQHPLVRPLFVTGMLQALAGSFFSALYVVFALRTLGLSQWMMGTTIAMGGVGALIGAVVAPAVAKRLGVGPAICFGYFAYGATGLLIPLAPADPWIGMVFLMLAQLFGDSTAVVAEVNATSLRQSVLPGDLLGRAQATFHVGMGAVGVVGALMGGVLGNFIGARETMFIAVTGMTAAALILFFSPLRRQRGIPDPN